MQKNRTDDGGSARMGYCMKEERTEIMMAPWTWKYVMDHRAEDSVSLLCNKNQQNAHFLHKCFNLIILSSTRFAHPSVHHQEDLYMQLYGISLMDQYEQDVLDTVSSTSCHRPDCLYGSMKEIP